MRLLKLLSIFALALLMGCSGGSKKQAASKSVSSTNDIRTIHIYGVDQMKFAVAEKTQGIDAGDPVIQGDSLFLLNGITVKPGEQVKIKLTTRSKLPASAMSHNWILLKNSGDPEAFDRAAIKAKDNDYVPADMTDQIIAHVPLTSGGNTSEITFTAPENAGDYEYMCSFPGHFSAGMKGSLTVKE